MRKPKRIIPGALLELWRPPKGAGEALGCLSSTYTFQPGIFDEQCLGRFLDVESDPDREDLAYFLEREHRLGSTYAGVLTDHTQAGVEHSLRWDLLPVRIPRGKQHAKLSILAWTNCIRVIVASANLTEPGYRFNREVAVSLDSTPTEARSAVVGDACHFFRRLMMFVPGTPSRNHAVVRARQFLNLVEQHTSEWDVADEDEEEQKQRLLFTLPGSGRQQPLSTLESLLDECESFHGLPDHVDVASPFFDESGENVPDATSLSLCQGIGAAADATLRFCVPSREDIVENTARLLAPRSLGLAAERSHVEAKFSILPQRDEDRNARVWHAKMVALSSSGQNPWTGLMIGSSNFTKAGMGVDVWNAEANLLTLLRPSQGKKDTAMLKAVWPEVVSTDELEIEWLGPSLDNDEESNALQTPLPVGFLSATFCSGAPSSIELEVNPQKLPQSWKLFTTGVTSKTLLTSDGWSASGSLSDTVLGWDQPMPPAVLHVHWTDKSGGEQSSVMTLNVEDASVLPPPIQVSGMTADEMLMILAATDPGAAFRIWAKRQLSDSPFDEDLDACDAEDLDPLQRYDLKATFLRRVRTRARILAQLRHNLQQPVATMTALHWKLKGFIGVEALSDRLLAQLEADGEDGDEALLCLADFMIVLMEVVYEPAEGSLPSAAFDGEYAPFLDQLVKAADSRVQQRQAEIGVQVFEFWGRVVARSRNGVEAVPTVHAIQSSLAEGNTQE